MKSTSHRWAGALAVTLVLALPLAAQESRTGKYTNKELGVTFSGVYGWYSDFAAGSGAWTELASYTEAKYDAKVSLQVRNNTFKTMDQLRKALKKEFVEGGEPTVGKPACKEIEYRDLEMRRGIKLKGVEVEGYAVRVTKEGKKREAYLLVRTYFGKNRLFRVACAARRSREKQVKDRFEIAIASLVVEGAAEAAVMGIAYTSQRGNYRCTVPLGFTVFLPARSTSEIRFFRGGITVSMFAYRAEGDLLDHRDQLIEFYGDDLKLDEEDGTVLGAPGFRGVVERKGKVTLISATFWRNRFYRIHTTGLRQKLADMKRVHAQMEKGYKLGSR